MNNQKKNDSKNLPSTLVNKITTQHLNQSPISPFQVINSNEQSPFTVEQTTNCRLNEPLSPFAMERNNNNLLGRKPNDSKNTNLKILTHNQKSPLNDHQVPISPFNMGSPNKNLSGPKTSQSSKGNQLFSAKVVDMPIIPQVDSYNQSNNRSSVVTTTSAINSASPAFYEMKRELNMSNINSMVSNVRKGQESNVIDKILFDTEYSGLVDQKYDNELVRHNSKNNTLFKCFSRSSSGIFSFKSPDTAPNSNSIYYIDVGNEVGTSKISMNKREKDNKNNITSTNNTPIGEKDIMKSTNLLSPKGNIESSQSPQHNNNKLTSVFTYDAEYLVWRNCLIDVLKNNVQESSDYIGAYYKNINNENQIDYMLKMPIELLTLLNTKIK